MKLIQKAITMGALILMITDASAQSDSAAAMRQFDFWLGHWTATWNDTMKGENHISTEYEGRLIHEQFSSPADSFFGQSHSVYNLRKQQWEQTWVDNQGSYMLFSGGMAGREMILRMQNAPPGKMMRMRFTNITHLSFDWYWESSKDKGKTWTTSWLIHYHRKT